MLTLTRRYELACSHQLHGLPEGHKCGRMHGHNYGIELTVAQKGELRLGMIIDAEHLDADFRPIFLRLDHRCLNECGDSTPAGETMAAQPTAENLALYLFARLQFLSNGPFTTLVRVRVYENDRLWADATGVLP